MSVSAYQPITAAQLQALAAKANAKGVYVGQGGPYVFGTNDTNWLTEFRRLRAQLQNVIAGNPENSYRINTENSGPWPVTFLGARLYSIFGEAFPVGGPYYDQTRGALRRIWFYAASATPPTVTVIHAPTIVDAPDTNNDGVDYPQNVTRSILVATNGSPVHFIGTIGFLLNRHDGSNAPAATVNTNMPGASWQIINGGTRAWIVSDFDVWLGSGVYTFEVQTSAGWMLQSNRQCLNAYFPGELAVNYGPLAYGARLESTPITGESAPGIHLTLPVWRCNCAPPGPVSGGIFGTEDPSSFGWHFLYKPYADKPASWRQAYSPAYVASTPGLWVGYTPPIQQIHNVVGYMPWNPLIPSGTNRGDPLLDLAVDPPIKPNEEQYVPVAGSEVASPRNQSISARVYTLGGAAYHVSLNAGTTGLNEPDWNPTKGGLTQDGTVSWRNLGTVKPAQARPYCLPSWPVYKQGSGNPYASMANWGHFQNPGPGTGQRYWFIHRVRINRINPVTADTYTMEGTGALFNQIDVQIGCIRNGVFVSFGSFKTGTWAAQYPVEEQHRVMWPIFTNDALVYQASEPVDVQAEICWFPVIGYGMNQPILSDHYNDTERLLDQL